MDPYGTTIPVAEMDVRVGGRRLLCMAIETPSGRRQMWFTGEYLEIVDGQRLVYTESVSDENGNVLPATEAGMPDGHPTTTKVAVELEILDGRTRMVMIHAGIPQDSPGATGWEMAFDKLATHLEEQAA